MVLGRNNNNYKATTNLKFDIYQNREKDINKEHENDRISL
jgi:hypothetical protein